MIKRNATLDPAMHLNLSPPLPNLPPNMSLVSTTPSEGLYQVSENTWDGERVGFVDELGKIVIKPQFASANAFSDGLSVVTAVTGAKTATGSGVEKVGAIDRHGNIVVTPIYDGMTDFEHGMAIAHTTEEGTGRQIDYAVNNQGRLMGTSQMPTRMSSMENFGSVIKVRTQMVLSLHKPDGTIIDLKDYDDIDTLSPGRRNPYDARDGFISKPAFPEYFKTSADNLYGLIDANGKEILAPRYKQINSFRRGVAEVSTADGQEEYVDSHGKTIFKIDGLSLTPFDDLVAGIVKGRWHFFDKAGHEVSVPKIDSILPDIDGTWFSDGMGAVVIKGKCGFVDANGKVVLPPIYDYATSFHGGYAAVWQGDGWFFVNKQGSQVTPKLASIARNADGSSTVAVAGPLYSLTEAKFAYEARRRFKNTLDSLKNSPNGVRSYEY